VRRLGVQSVAPERKQVKVLTREMPSRNFTPFQAIIKCIVLLLARTEGSAHVGAQLTVVRQRNSSMYSFLFVFLHENPGLWPVSAHS